MFFSGLFSLPFRLVPSSKLKTILEFQLLSIELVQYSVIRHAQIQNHTNMSVRAKVRNVDPMNFK